MRVNIWQATAFLIFHYFTISYIPGTLDAIHWKLDIADTAENLGLKDTFLKTWATMFYFQYISPLEIAEHLGLADKKVVADFSANSSFRCTEFLSTIFCSSGSGGFKSNEGSIEPI